MAVKFGGECLFDVNHYNVFKTYCDLFMTVNKKEQYVYQGISSLKLIKLRWGLEMHNILVQKETCSMFSGRDL